MNKTITLHMGTVCMIAVTVVGCSKTPSQPTAQEVKLLQEPPTPVNKYFKDLGVVELSERTPKHLSLGEGKDCVLTMTILADGNLKLVFTSESETSDGLPTRILGGGTFPPGHQVVVGIGDGVGVALTAIVKVK